ncbi:MAG: ribonuclease PH [Polyangiaceae bacterium]
MPRPDGRAFDAPRPLEIIPHFHRNAEGSVLYRAGHTVVLCTASIDSSVPAWMTGKGSGWLTAEYQMHPRSSPTRRESRDGRGKAPSGRTQEIQRLIGRALRSAIDLAALGERSLMVDCDVLEADGGTRTASITGSFIAVAIALDKLRVSGQLTRPVVRELVSAISVGLVEDKSAGDSPKHELAVDLVYEEDSKARVDLNLVATDKGRVIEVQGTAEGEPIERATLDRMIDAGLATTSALCARQRAVLTQVGVDLDKLLIPRS